MRWNRIEAIAVLGSGLQTYNGNLDISLDQITRLRAGVVLYRRQVEAAPKNYPLIILCGGKVFKGYEPISRYAKAALVDRLGIPRDRVRTVEDSLDTVSDVRGAKRLMDEMGVKRGVVVSSWYHLAARSMATKCGMKFEPAEGVLGENPANFREAIVEIRRNPESRNKLLGQLARAILVWTPGGEVYYQQRAVQSLPIRAIITEAQFPPGTSLDQLWHVP